MSKRRKQEKYKDVAIDLPESVMRDLRHEVRKLREQGVRVSVGYLIKQRLATALAASTFSEVMKHTQIKEQPWTA
jgi:nicotinic acid phosphoribosyltransferase